MSRHDPKTGPRWYVLRAGTETGPYTSHELRAMARAGELAPGDYVNVRPSSPGTARRADTVPGLFPAAAVAEPAPIPLVEAVMVDDDDDAGEPVRRKPRRRSDRSLHDLLTFRVMVTPILIQVIFWVGTLTCVYKGMTIVIESFHVESARYVSSWDAGPSWDREPAGRKSKTLDLDAFARGLALMVLGPLVLRIACEMDILLFKIHDELKAANDRNMYRTRD